VGKGRGTDFASRGPVVGEVQDQIREGFVGSLRTWYWSGKGIGELPEKKKGTGLSAFSLGGEERGKGGRAGDLS